MSGAEFLIVLGGLAVGYWVVSKFLFGQPREPARPEAVPASAGIDNPAPDGPAPTCHEILQVSPQASVPEIRQAYRTLISQYHPDKVATLGPELQDLAARKSAQINEAYRQALLEHNAAP